MPDRDAKKIYGLLAQYDTTADLYHACEKVRDAGYTKWDAHTPFAVHGLDKAMGLKPSVLPWVVFICGMAGASGLLLLQYWSAALAYPVIIAAKPLFSYQANVPVTFEGGILLSAFGAVFGMLVLNRLPQYYHPLFNSPRFDRVTDDKFFISIEAEDPKFSDERTRRLLESTHPSHLEEVED